MPIEKVETVLICAGCKGEGARKARWYAWFVGYPRSVNPLYMVVCDKHAAEIVLARGLESRGVLERIELLPPWHLSKDDPAMKGEWYNTFMKKVYGHDHG